jgi:hypothetical protein
MTTIPLVRQTTKTLLNNSYRPILVALAIVYFTFQVGIYRLPGSVNEWLHISTIGPFGDGHWSVLSRNQATPTLARALGITTPDGWRAMTLMIALFATILLTYAITRLASSPETLCVLLMLVLFSPIIRAIFNGQADYDGLTIVCLAVILISDSKSLTALAAIVLGFTSPEQGTLALLVLVIVSYLLDRQRTATFFLALILQFLTARVNRHVILSDENIYWMPLGQYHTLNQTLQIGFHAFAGAWVFVVASLYIISKHKGYRTALVISGCLFLLPAIAYLVTSDGARNFTPILMTGSVFVLRFSSEKLKQQHLLGLIGLAVLLQAVYLFGGLNDFEQEFPTIYENLSSRPNPLP